MGPAEKGINWVLGGITVSETGFVSFPSHRLCFVPSDAAIAINTASRFHSAFPHSPPSVSGTCLLRRHSFFIIIIGNNKREEELWLPNDTRLHHQPHARSLCRFRFEFGSGPSLLRCWIGQCLQRKGWRDLPLIGFTNSYVRIDGDFGCCRFVEEKAKLV